MAIQTHLLKKPAEKAKVAFGSLRCNAEKPQPWTGLSSITQKLQSLKQSLKILLWFADPVGRWGFKPRLAVSHGIKE